MGCGGSEEGHVDDSRSQILSARSAVEVPPNVDQLFAPLIPPTVEGTTKAEPATTLITRYNEYQIRRCQA